LRFDNQDLPAQVRILFPVADGIAHAGWRVVVGKIAAINKDTAHLHFQFCQHGELVALLDNFNRVSHQ